MVVAMVALVGGGPALSYLEAQNFTEPMFVFAIMVGAASRPILRLATRIVRLAARAMPLRGQPLFPLQWPVRHFYFFEDYADGELNADGINDVTMQAF